MNTIVTTDKDGKRFLVNSDTGEFLLDEYGHKIPPTYGIINSKPGEFITYDTSQGHCGLCGRLGCHGTCFK